MAIKERSDGKFDVRVTKHVHGQLKEARRRGVKSKGDARRIEGELLSELIVTAASKKIEHVTWLQALEDFFPWKKKKLAFSTFQSLEDILLKHTSRWNERATNSFVAAEIEELVEKSYPEESMESKRKLLRFIRDVFNRQIQLGKLQSNPCAGLSFGKAPEKELIAMTRPEIEILLDQAKKDNHEWYPIWLVMYGLGLRSGEGIALTWNDIDFVNKRASISKSFCTKSKKLGPTKNRKTRTLPINQRLLEFLTDQKSKLPERNTVLPILKEWLRGDAAEILRSYQKDLGIRQTNFHSLRASFITHLLLANTPVTKVQILVGHSDLKTTQRYVRLVASDMDGATEAIAIKNEI